MVMKHPKTIFITTKADGRVNGWSSSPLTAGEDIQITIPDDHPFLRFPFDYRYVNGTIEKVQAYVDEAQARYQKAIDTPPLTEVVAAVIGAETDQKTVEVAEQFNKAVLLFVQSLPEASKLEIPEVYPAWEVGKDYAVGATIRYGKDPAGKSQLFVVLQVHKSQADWLPTNLAALYKKISFSANGVPDWKQPVGAVDAYALNALVMHKKLKWKSTVAANVWEPSVYGWVQVPL